MLHNFAGLHDVAWDSVTCGSHVEWVNVPWRATWHGEVYGPSDVERLSVPWRAAWRGEVYGPTDMERLTVPWRAPWHGEVTHPLIWSGLLYLEGTLTWRSFRALWYGVAYSYCTLKGPLTWRSFVPSDMERLTVSWRATWHGEVYGPYYVERLTVPWRVPWHWEFTGPLIWSGLLYLEGSRDVK